MRKLPYFILTALLPIFLCSCYSKRWTQNLEEYPVMTEQRSAIVDEAGMSEDDIRLRDEKLREINKAPVRPYTINAGDEVTLSVYDHPELGGRTMVTPDGRIGIVFLGDVKVEGLTLQEASKKIEEGLGKYITKPAVGLAPWSISSETATIAGAVEKTGTYVISTGMKLSDLYAKAGGSSVRRFGDQDLDAADLVNSRFVRNGKILPVDFRKAIEEGDPTHNLFLRKDDYIYVAVRSESMVCLVGHVKRPHKHLWDNSLGLIELLTDGGWVEETYWPYVVILRGGVADPHMYRVDVDAIMTGRCPNIMLQSGDVVYVPHDNASEWNVFVRKIMPSAQLIQTLCTPLMWWNAFD